MPLYNNHDYVNIMRPLPDNYKCDIYGIPFIKKQDIDIVNINNGKWLINPHNLKKDDKKANVKIVHSFLFDKDLNRYYNNIWTYLDNIASYYASCSFDFSMHEGMREAQIIDAVFKNRWSGAYLQSLGRRVIATVGWVDEDTYDICFAGLEDGAVFIISTLGVCNDDCKDGFLRGFFEMRKRFPHSPIICVGQKLKEMPDDVCYIKYNESFGRNCKFSEFWQPRLFNWDMSISQEVI